jgi:hypothetical protein
MHINKMKHEKIEESKILKICKVVSFIMILNSVSYFYFERVSFLEQDKKWRIDLIEKGENVYRGTKIVWKNLSETQKKFHILEIKKVENRIKFNTYLIIKHLYNLFLNIILFASLFILNRWVKRFLIFWILSDHIVIPIYYYIIGYDSFTAEQFSIGTFKMNVAVITFTLLAYTFLFYMGWQIFKLIDIKSEEHNKTGEPDGRKPGRGTLKSLQAQKF